MNYAASLLRSDKTLKVAEIAGLVGYDSPSKFASAFHQTMGKTPLEYRKSIILLAQKRPRVAEEKTES